MKINHFSDHADSNKIIHLRSTNKSVFEHCSFETSKDEQSQQYLSSVFYTVNGNVSMLDSSTGFSFFSNKSSYYGLKGSFSSYMNSDPLPICVRYKSRNAVVIERPPFKIPVRIRYGKSNYYSRIAKNEQYENDIWIPWSILIITSNNGFSKSAYPDYEFMLFFRDSPLSSFDDFLVPAYTPNVFVDGRMCLGKTKDILSSKITEKEFDSENISKIYSFVANEYFSGGWNMDVTGSGYNTFLQKTRDINFLQSVVKKAEEFKNNYIINLNKKFHLTDSSYSGNSTYNLSMRLNGKRAFRCYINYLSFLNLEEINSFLATIHSSNKKDGSILTLKNILLDHDISFNTKRNKDIDYIYEEIERDFKNQFSKHCSSNGDNSVALHSWKIKILFNTEDFLRSSSDRIMRDYDNSGWSCGYPLEQEKSQYYKKSIAYGLANDQYKERVNILISDYFSRILDYYKQDVSSQISKKVKEISCYFRNFDYASSSVFKHSFELDLSNFVLDDSLLKKDSNL